MQAQQPERKMILVRHAGRPELEQASQELAASLESYGVKCLLCCDRPLDDDPLFARPAPSDISCEEHKLANPAVLEGLELIVSLGGDGTLLRTAEYARHYQVPMVGINFGHVGFLTAAEAQDLPELARRLGKRDYKTTQRMCVQVRLTTPSGQVFEDWALNEAAIVSTDHAHPAHLGLGIDGAGITTYGADGLVIATPSGSTAYSFSAGGPVVWPDVEAMVISPLSAHGLFTRPLVISPYSQLEVSVLEDNFKPMRLWCDGRRSLMVPSGSFITATKDTQSIALVQLDDAPFAYRLVTKFQLPVKGWRCQ